LPVPSFVPSLLNPPISSSSSSSSFSSSFTSSVSSNPSVLDTSSPGDDSYLQKTPLASSTIPNSFLLHRFMSHNGSVNYLTWYVVRVYISLHKYNYK
jgi:hypothetical protein